MCQASEAHRTCAVCNHCECYHTLTCERLMCGCKAAVLNKDLPRPITFEEIKKGDTIRATWNRYGVKHTTEGVADRPGSTDGLRTVWYSKGGDPVAFHPKDSERKRLERVDTDYSLVLVDRPSEHVPTEMPAYIEATHNNGAHCAMMALTPSGKWVGLDDQGSLRTWDSDRLYAWTELEVKPKEVS